MRDVIVMVAAFLAMVAPVRAQDACVVKGFEIGKISPIQRTPLEVLERAGCEVGWYAQVLADSCLMGGKNLHELPFGTQIVLEKSCLLPPPKAIEMASERLGVKIVRRPVAPEVVRIPRPAPVATAPTPKPHRVIKREEVVKDAEVGSTMPSEVENVLDRQHDLIARLVEEKDMLQRTLAGLSTPDSHVAEQEVPGGAPETSALQSTLLSVTLWVLLGVVLGYILARLLLAQGRRGQLVVDKYVLVRNNMGRRVRFKREYRPGLGMLVSCTLCSKPGLKDDINVLSKHANEDCSIAQTAVQQ